MIKSKYDISHKPLLLFVFSSNQQIAQWTEWHAGKLVQQSCLEQEV